MLKIMDILREISIPDSKVIYGDPMNDQCKKLHTASMDAVCGEYKEPIYGFICIVWTSNSRKAIL